jgi:hypothetical protein
MPVLGQWTKEEWANVGADLYAKSEFEDAIEAFNIAIEIANNPMREVSAKKILEQINNGDAITYDHVKIKGDLILKKKSPLNVITSSIKITNSEIQGDLKFQDSIFKREINFSNSLFLNDITSFRNSSFNGHAVFSNSEFQGLADFKLSRFENAASFNRVKFKHVADFSESDFKGNANFSESDFYNLASFWKTYFYAPVFFTYSNFKGNGVNLGLRWGGIADFSYTQFNQPVYFYNSNWNGSASFIDTQFNHYIRGWRYLRNSFKSDEATHLGLIKNLKDHGLYNDADDCYYSYRYLYMSSPLDYLGWISCGFGVRPLRTLVFAFEIILIFALIFLKFKVIQYSDSSIPKTSWEALKDCLFFSALLFFTLYPPKNWDYMHNWRLVILLEDIMGWLVMALFIVTLGNGIIR